MVGDASMQFPDGVAALMHTLYSLFSCTGGRI